MSSLAARTVVIGRNAVERLLVTGLPATDLEDSKISFGQSDVGISEIDDGEFTHICGPNANYEEALLVIGPDIDGMFEALPRNARDEMLLRILRAATSTFDHTHLPLHWKPFHKDQLLSFQAAGYGKSEKARVLLFQQNGPPRAAFVFGLTRNQTDFDHAHAPTDILDRAIASWKRTISTPRSGAASGAAVDLGNTAIRGLTLGKTLGELVRLLNPDQKKFLDLALNAPLRLRGAAGTGKTLAMVVKLLSEAHQRLSRQENFRLLFVTHNSASAALTRDMVVSLDNEEIFKRADPERFIRIDTLLGLAYEHLTLELGDIAPISLDALEGKKLQLFHIEEALAQVKGTTFPLISSNLSPEIRSSVEAPPNSALGRSFRWNLMIEIACALDGEGVRDQPEKRRAYLKSRRREYQWPLNTEYDRNLVLDVYDAYRSSLNHHGAISVDQMIADFVGQLDSFRWSARKAKEGYDAVFVDEFHLFNRLERDVFPGLFRQSNPPLPLVVAYDAKQSPRDSFLDADERTPKAIAPAGDSKVGEATRIDLKQIYRHTKAISKVVECILGHFPTAHDIGDDWNVDVGQSTQDLGEVPNVFLAEDTLSLYKEAFGIARSAVQRSRHEGRQVAVLTLNHDAFAQVSTAGQFADQFIVVDSREDLDRLSLARRRFIFSMPEFVAGLQFDHVIVVDANEKSEQEDRTKLAGKRRTISSLYLAASRARSRLTIGARRDAGGFAAEVKDAISANLMTFRA